jgi:hypothetical protein
MISLLLTALVVAGQQADERDGQSWNESPSQQDAENGG